MRYHSLVDDDEDASALTDDSLLRAVAGAPPRAPAEPPLAAGTILGGFRVVSMVGAGGPNVATIFEVGDSTGLLPTAASR